MTFDTRKRLRIFPCDTCGNEVRSYNVHRKYCDDCRKKRDEQQQSEGKARADKKEREQKQNEQPLDPGKEDRILGLIGKYEAIDQLCLAHKIRPQSAMCYAVDELLNKYA